MTNAGAFWSNSVKRTHDVGAVISHTAVQLDNFLVIFGGYGNEWNSPFMNVIWLYNLYTEEWRKHEIPEHVIDKTGAPKSFLGAVAVAINETIYTFGGQGFELHADGRYDRNELWILSKGKTGYFTWSLIKFQHKKESPSPRIWHTGWEYSGKMWVFGGEGPSPEHYLNDHGDIAISDHWIVNNQLLCYNPNTHKWTNPQCVGAVPTPRFQHVSTVIEHKVWIFRGCDCNMTVLDDIFELTMHSLTWTHIQTIQPGIRARISFTLTTLTNNQLVLHGGNIGSHMCSEALSDTWIMDLTSYSWRQYKSRKDHARVRHTASVGLNNNVIIIGGTEDNCKPNSESYQNVFHVMLEAKSLQQLAAQIIYKYHNEINWNCLPNKLISILGLTVNPPTPKN